MTFRVETLGFRSTRWRFRVLPGLELARFASRSQVFSLNSLNSVVFDAVAKTFESVDRTGALACKPLARMICARFHPCGRASPGAVLKPTRWIV